MNIIKNFKEKTVIDYEIDKKKLEYFYGIKETKQPSYTIIQKKILFSKETSINSIDKRKQYSHYETFRKLTTSEYDKEEMKNEIASVTNLLKYSQSLRKELLTTLNIQKLLMPSNSPSEKNSIQQSSGNSKLIERKWKKAMNTVKITDELLKKCRLLKIKLQQDDNDQHKTEFRLHCQLEKQTYESAMNQICKLNIKFFNQKGRILKGYNREKVFIGYINHCKEDIVKASVDDINQDIKDQFSQELIYSIYHPRENGFYFKYDSFMENYNITPSKVKNSERDLYDHIYSILSKCNYVNFLSFLYSKNNLFKFIYDEFSDKDAGGDYANISNKIEESFQQDKGKEKDKEKDKDKQMQQHSGQLNTQDMQIFNNSNKLTSNFLDNMVGSDTCLRVGVIPDPISEESINKFNNKIIESNQNDNFINKVIQCQNADFNYVFIMKNGSIKIFSPELDDNQDDLSENNIISKIKQKNDFTFEIETIEATIIEIKSEDIPDEELLTVTSQVFYLLKEITDEINYYLFKIKYEYKKIFETVIDKLKIKKSNLKELNKSVSDDGGTIEFGEIQKQLTDLKKGKQTEESAKDDSDGDNQNQLFDLKEKLFPTISMKDSLKNEQHHQSQPQQQQQQQQQQNTQSQHSGSLNEIKNIVKEVTSEKFKPVGILK